MSTFRDDGYRDAMQFQRPYPPDVNIYAQEYMEGFKKGRIDRHILPEGSRFADTKKIYL